MLRLELEVDQGDGWNTEPTTEEMEEDVKFGGSDGLKTGLKEIIQEYPHAFVKHDLRSTTTPTTDFLWDIKFRFLKELQPGKLHCRLTSDTEETWKFSAKIIIEYSDRVSVFRGLGRILGAWFTVTHETDLSKINLKQLLEFEEKRCFDTLGLMIDCSRNAVLLVDQVRALIRKSALLGLNTLQLYTEDTYEVDGEPFFGYLRGRYTKEELKMIDNYAYIFGIEVFPCIQTLGHFGQVLQWPQFAAYKDTNEVLLAQDEQTYHFIEKMITSISQNFRSRRIHVGMDEAHGLGEGRFKKLFGSKDHLKIFVDHLSRVKDICQRHGLQPLMWSDMLFCLATDSDSLNGYYESNADSISREVVSDVPSEGVFPVYWDYYHSTKDTYIERIEAHQKIGIKNLWVAGGIWTWNRFWPALNFTLTATQGCLEACKMKELGIKNVFITVWGDDGNECDTLACLPGLHFFAEHGHCSGTELDAALLKRNFAAISQGNFDDWIEASKLDEVFPEDCSSADKIHYPSNVSKWLLWEDPIMSFLSPQVEHLNLVEHYKNLANRLILAAQRSEYPQNRRLYFPHLIAQVISLKHGFIPNLKNVIALNSKSELKTFVMNDLALLRESIDRLWKYHSQLWLDLNKAFGLEVIELRYGGIRTRLESLHGRLMQFIEGKESQLYLPELDVPLLKIYDHNKSLPALFYQRAVTTSRNLGTG